MPPERSQVDLHGMSREAAQRAVERALHAARVRGDAQVLLITGRGYGNKLQQPVLRNHIEAWLRGPEGRARGVRALRVVSRGGALEVDLSGGADKRAR